MAPDTDARLEEAIAEIVRTSASKALAGVDLTVDRSGDQARVTGAVVTPRQAREVHRLAESYGAQTDISVLADPEDRLEEVWLAVTGDDLGGGVLELWREPALMGRDHARQTEYLPADGPLRQLGRRDAGVLVQGPDLTLGWIGEVGVRETDGDEASQRWHSRRRAEAGAAVLPDPSLLTFGGGAMDMLSALVTAARENLGVPYRWGGTTPAGFDCSGLVQRVFASKTGVLLPKHTGDQRHAGVRVPPASARAGDLLFATPRSQHVGHVMLVSSPDTVIHACRTEERVIEEPLEVNAERYQHQGYRRPVLLLP